MKIRLRGFTLVELLVVIAIIGILIGMLLPAVQAVRESARRISCANKLRQLAIALLNYESADEEFPPGWTSVDAPGDPGYGWMAFMLPFVEQGNIQIDVSVPILDLPINGARAQSFDVLFCPSSSHREPTYLLAGSGGNANSFPFEISRTHYVGSLGGSVPEQIMSDGGI